jgi:sugar phosphate isomerase/epimerase
MKTQETLALGIVSDEIALDFRTALRHGLSWGITQYEIRCLKTGRVPEVDPAEWEDLLGAVKEHGIVVTALSPGMFKHPLSKRVELELEVTGLLPRTIAMAGQCGATMIIAFGFQRERGEPASNHALAVDLFRRAAEAAAGAGMRIAIENEPGFHCDTGVNTRRIIEEVGSPALGANWDPCNAFGTDEVPYPAGYDAIKRVIINVHAKDTAEGSLIRCVPIGEGVIDWQGQMKALMRDRIVGHVTIETHCLPLIEQSAKNVQMLRSIMEKET